MSGFVLRSNVGVNMSQLSDSESSDSSNEFLVPANKIDFSSSFFKSPKTAKKKQPQPNPKSKWTPAVERLSSDEDEDEFDCSHEDNVSSAELLAQVLKNLENTKNQSLIANTNQEPSTSIQTKESSIETKNDLSNEINDLLMQGESTAIVSKEDDVNDNEEDSKENIKKEYVIPEKGVQIHLPGESFIFDKKKKKQQDLQKMLQNKINQRIRKTQVFAHKVGLLCWLAYGFHLNKLASDPDLLGITLSLVSPQNYPKGKADLKYFEKLTKWFGSLFKIQNESKEEIFTKDLLLERVSDKQIFNYIEMVLLYIATLRAMGINCRLVISLSPPRLKPSRDQLFKIPEDKDDKSSNSIKKEKKENSIDEDVKNISKKLDTKTVKGRPGRKKLASQEQVSPSKVPENSPEASKAAKEEARKKAAEVLKKFKNSSNTKIFKSDLNIKTNNSKDLQKIENEENLRENNTKKTQNSSETHEKNNKNVKNENIKNSNNVNEKDNKTNQEDKKSNKINKKNSKNAQKNIVKAENIDQSNNSSCDEENDKNLSISRKLSLRVKKKIEADKSKPLSSKNKKKNQTRKGKKNLSDEEMSEIEEEVDSSSEFSAKDDFSEDYSTDEDYEEKKPKKRTKNFNKSLEKSKTNTSIRIDKKLNTSIKSGKKTKNPRKILSTDDETDTSEGGYNVWVEVYVESEESWISVSVLEQKVNCVSDLYKAASQPVLYVIAWNSSGLLKDVTRRYCPHWLTDTRKKRVEEKWWTDTLSNWKEKNTAISKAEDEQLLQKELEQPLPKTVGECKGHPLYVLQRHLLKFEALYPPDAAPLGHLKTGEAIYSRYCVHTLYSRETWFKHARVVKPAQEPYKIVKALPKYDKLSGTKIKNLPLELFGKWQTTPYEPPPAKDGKVPRNEYGNVDLFKMSMLPKGCVYIDLPALNRIARKLNIDCAPACIGFNFGCRGALPAFQGFVVCEEYEDTLREAWEEEQVLAKKRANEKHEKRVYGNWKKLIKGLLIREKLAAKYNFGEEENVDDETKPAEDEKLKKIRKLLKTKQATPKGKKISAVKHNSDKDENTEDEEEMPEKLQKTKKVEKSKKATPKRKKSTVVKHNSDEDYESTDDEEEVEKIKNIKPIEKTNRPQRKKATIAKYNFDDDVDDEESGDGSADDEVKDNVEKVEKMELAEKSTPKRKRAVVNHDSEEDENVGKKVEKVGKVVPKKKRNAVPKCDADSEENVDEKKVEKVEKAGKTSSKLDKVAVVVVDPIKVTKKRTKQELSNPRKKLKK